MRIWIGHEALILYYYKFDNKIRSNNVFSFRHGEKISHFALADVVAGRCRPRCSRRKSVVPRESGTEVEARSALPCKTLRS